MALILELFAGAGGASLGVHRAIPDATVIGVEWDPSACATRAAAGLLTIRADIATMATGPLTGHVCGLWCSPPCPQFSAAGLGSGVAVLGLLAQGVTDLLQGRDTRAEIARLIEPVIRELVTLENGARREARTAEQIEAETFKRRDESLLVLEPARFAHDLRPEWVACEQVPAALPLWRVMARGLTELGYSCWAGILDTADFGVPQNRKRAILMARQGAKAVLPPEPSHQDTRQGGSLFGLPSWVSMADALGWGMEVRPALTVAVGTGGGPDPSGVGGSGARRTLERERERQWVAREH